MTRLVFTFIRFDASNDFVDDIFPSRIAVLHIRWPTGADVTGHGRAEFIKQEVAALNNRSTNFFVRPVHVLVYLLKITHNNSD